MPQIRIHKKKNIRKIEGIQRSATKMVPSLRLDIQRKIGKIASTILGREKRKSEPDCRVKVMKGRKKPTNCPFGTQEKQEAITRN